MNNLQLGMLAGLLEVRLVLFRVRRTVGNKLGKETHMEN